MNLKGRTMWIAGALILSAIIAAISASALTAKWHRDYYEQALRAKETQIQSLLADVNEKESLVVDWKRKAKNLAGQVVKVDKRIRALRDKVKEDKDRMQTITTPQNVEETTNRLKALGLNPERSCDDEQK